MVVFRSVSHVGRPPRLLVPAVFVLCLGVAALVVAVVMRRFLLLFITAGSIWIEFLLYLYYRWWPGIPFVPGRRKIYRGIAIFVGLLVFAGAWYIIIRFDPSRR